jgi:IS30 family transposase
MKSQRTARVSRARKIDRAKVADLAQQGLGVMDIAVHQGVHHSTISRYLARLSLEGRTLKEFTERRADALALVHAKALQVQDILLDHIEGEVSNKEILNTLSGHQKVAYLNAAAVVGGVAYDKYRLEVGKSTENVGLLTRIISEAHNTLFTSKRSNPPNPPTQDERPPEGTTT